jgi:hypothetical protein
MVMDVAGAATAVAIAARIVAAEEFAGILLGILPT